jgi:hypothetical protein
MNKINAVKPHAGSTISFNRLITMNRVDSYVHISTCNVLFNPVIYSRFIIVNFAYILLFFIWAHIVVRLLRCNICNGKVISINI